MSSEQFTNLAAPVSVPAKLPSSLRYLFVLLAVPALLYLLPFTVVRMDAYPRLSSNPDDFPILGFAFNPGHRNSDVVVYGDSTANHGIDPSQMSAALGVKVVNLPGNASVLLVDDDLPLRHYLAENSPPKVIVLYVAAWNLNYGDEGHQTSALYTGLEMLLRYGSAPDVWSFFKSHRESIAQFPLMFYRANITPGGILRRGILRQEALQVAATNGHTDSIGMSRYGDDCVIPDTLIQRIAYGSVRKLRDKYSTPQTKVLVFVAPIPSCRNANTVVERSKLAAPVAPPKIIAAPLYVNDAYYAHLYSDGVPVATQNLVDAVRPLLTAPSP